MNGRNRSSFWSTLPGILTGLAGVVTAVATLVAVGLQLTGPAETGAQPPPPPPRTSTHETRGATIVSWAEEANRLCEDTVATIRALGTPATPADTAPVLRATIAANWQLHTALRALAVPAGDETDVESLLATLARFNDHGERVVAALESFDEAAASSEWNGLLAAEAEFDAAAIRLGASTCAQDG